MHSKNRINPLAPFLKNTSHGAIGLIFLIHALPLSTWIIYIPYMKDKLALSEGQLGIALFCFAVGAVIMMPLSSIFIRRWGDGKTTAYSTWLNCLLFMIPLFSNQFSILCLTLFLVGMSGGLMDISMNATASVLEKKSQTYIMSGCHGFFSLGAMLGSSVGGLIAATHISPTLHMIVLNILLAGFQFFLLKHYFYIKDITSPSSDRRSFNVLPIMGIAIIAMCLMMGEGAIHDWSTVYMKEVAGAPITQMGLGFAGYSLAMAVGRFMGDHIQEKFQAKTIIIVGGLIASIGLAIVLIASTFSSIAGFTLVGIGLSGMVPVLFREASRIPNITAAQGIATVAGVGYTGLLLGPVILGFIAQYSSLYFSFLFVIGLIIVSMILSISTINE